jgi:hypothetical protein
MLQREVLVPSAASFESRNSLYWSYIMNTKLIAAVLIAASAAIAAPAFAGSGSGGGGTGPAGPVGYDWSATPQGQQVQKAWAARAERQAAARNANTGYGGSDSTGSQSGTASPVGEVH